MNVLDHLKHLKTTEVKRYCKDTCIDASVAMIRTHGDFNLSTVVRNANFFGFKEVIHVSSSRKWDRRGSVGTHHYTSMKHFYTEADFLNNYDNSLLIAVENNIPKYSSKTIYLQEMTISDFTNPIFIFGEEQCGLDDFILDRSDIVLTIPAYGSVRSLNVGTTSGIVMQHYRGLIEKHRTLHENLID